MFAVCCGTIIRGVKPVSIRQKTVSQEAASATDRFLDDVAMHSRFK